MTINYYKILGIPEGSSREEIKKAYRELVRKWHPDKNGNSKESTEMTQKINKAFEVLEKNGEVHEGGLDYDSKVPTEASELAIAKPLDGTYWVHYYLWEFNMGRIDMVSDYYLIRARRMLEALSVYKKIYNGNSMKFLMEVGMKMNGFQWWIGQSSWETNVKGFKSLLNKAQRALGLPETTEQDLQIEGKISNESPKIPGNNEPDKINGNQETPKIKDRVASVEEYNNLYHKGNHETIRKYNKLRDMIYNTPESWEKYTAVNSILLKEMDAKAIEAEKGTFREIWTNNDENKVGEIKRFNESKLEKMKEVIKLMERLIEEGKNYKPTVENTSSQDKKHKADEFEARQGMGKRSKTVDDELSRLIREAQELNNYEELEAKIKEIDKFQEEKIYNKQYKEEIEHLKNKLGNLNKDKYRENIIKQIEDKLNEGIITENELDEETKNKLVKVRNGEIKEVSEINEVEGKVVAKVGEKKALNTLNDWLNQAKKLVEEITKGATDKLRQELQKVKKGLYSFQFSTNVYCQNAYQNKEKDVKAALSKLENYSANNTTQPTGNLPWKIIIPASLAAVLAVAMIIVVRRRKPSKVVVK